MLFLTNTVFSQNVHGAFNSNNAIPYAIVEIPPAPPNCNQNSGTHHKICTSKFIQEYFEIKLDRQVFRDADVTDFDITIAFVINQEGNVENVQMNHENEFLKKYLNDITKALPQFTPGKQGDTIVDVGYVIPISYKASK